MLLHLINRASELLLLFLLAASAHCSHMGPHLETRVPMGTFFSFWVPIRSPLGPIRSPFSILGLRTREKSVQPPSNVDYLITCDNTEFIQYKWHKHCALNDDTPLWIFFQKKSLFQRITSFRSIFQIYAFWVPISAVEGPHWVPISLKIRSPLGPHEKYFGSPLNVGAVGQL